MSSKKISIFPELLNPSGLEHTVLEYGNANYKIKLNTILSLVNKSMVGLGNVNNTSDMDKAVSTATGIALAGKANLSHTHTGYANTNSPEFTGTPTAPTAAPGTSTTQIATTAFVMAASGGAGEIPDATTLIKGKVQLATPVEVTAGEDNAKAVTPAGLKSVSDSLALQSTVNNRFDDVDTQFIAVYEHVSSVRVGLEQTDSDTWTYVQDTRDGLRIEINTAFDNASNQVTQLSDSLSERLDGLDDRASDIEETIDAYRKTVDFTNVASLTQTLLTTAAGIVTRFTVDGAKTLTVDSITGHASKEIYHVSNRSASGNLTLTPAGAMVLNAPKGGALVLEPGDTVSLHCISPTVMDVYGSTLAA